MKDKMWYQGKKNLKGFFVIFPTNYTKKVIKPPCKWFWNLKQKVFESIPRKFTKTVNRCLAKPISNNEFYLDAKSMAMNKVLGLNGMAIEFHTFFWYFIGEDFHRMIEKSIKENNFSKGKLQRSDNSLV